MIAAQSRSIGLRHHLGYAPDSACRSTAIQAKVVGATFFTFQSRPEDRMGALAGGFAFELGRIGSDGDEQALERPEWKLRASAQILA